MSEPTAVNTIARERIDSIASRNGEPDWLKDLRFKAWEAYFRLPMPTGRKLSTLPTATPLKHQAG